MTFNVRIERVDILLASFLHGNSTETGWNICKLILTLSHGQGAVGRGFSVNKELLVENLEKVFTYQPKDCSRSCHINFYRSYRKKLRIYRYKRIIFEFDILFRVYSRIHSYHCFY